MAIGNASIARRDDELINAADGFRMPGLIDAHVHLLPGAADLAAQFGVTTLIDQFSKPGLVTSERADGLAKARIRSSTISATAPGGHPSIAYAPIPYVSGPADAEKFVADRLGVDVLAHAPFSAMTDPEINEVAHSGVAVIATLSILDGFSLDGVMPLLAQAAIKARLTVRWQRVIEHKSDRWMPPEGPSGAAQREHVLALLESGVRVIAGTDAPNPGLLPGPSLHRNFSNSSDPDCAPSKLYELRPVSALARSGLRTAA